MIVEKERIGSLTLLAERLAKAWQDMSLIDDLKEEEIPVSRAEAYLVADRMAVEIGDAQTGWKVGATSARMRELDGHEDVIPGRIFRSVTWEGDDHDLPTQRFPQARVEAEFAFCLSQDVTTTEIRDPERMAAIVLLHPAIEIIGNRFVAEGLSPKQNSLMTVADNGGGIGFVFGEPIANWRDIDLRNHRVRVSVDGHPPSENFVGELRAAPLAALCDLAAHLMSRGYSLQAGDYVSTGAACKPQPIGAGSKLEADFGNLGKITARFT